MNILFAIFEGIWRRAFGSGNFNRAILHIINVVATIFVLMYVGISWWRVVVVAPVFEFLFWARAVGMYQDIGNGGMPDEKMLKRYNAMWYNRFLDKWFPNYKYSDLYDFTGLAIRYTLPAILVSIIIQSPIFWLAGFCVACIYALCWKFENYKYIENPTEWAELLSGFTTGFLLTLFI